MEKKIGIIGGSGLYNIEGLTEIEEIEIDTPYGLTSDTFFKGKIDDVELFFLPRHGRNHTISPSDINSRANIYGFRKLGVKVLLSVSAVGSMKEEIKPGDMVIIDQFIDRTRKRVDSFFEKGIVGHVSLAEPVCPIISNILYETSSKITKTHRKGTYITIEGPYFSTKAESLVYRSLGVDVIGMTASPEYKLAREAEMHYGIIALSTDYDCWKEGEEAVSVENVIKTLKNNVNNAKEVIKSIVPLISKNWDKLKNCHCENALNNAVMTHKEAMSTDVYNKMELFLSKYF